MNGDRMRFGLIGAGAIAQSYGQAFQELGHAAELVGIADVRLDAARTMAEVFGCPYFESHEDLAERTPCEAVIVCTPPSSHLEVARHFLERGVHVLCEKPLAPDAASARQMIEAAEEHHVKLTMASKFRFVSDVVRAKNIVTSGILGDLILFENAFTARVDMAGRWNANPKVSGGGVLIDNGTHSVDLMRYFLGPIAEVQVVEGKRMQALEVEDTVRIFIRSAGGVVGTVDLSWTINKECDSYIDIYGSHGTIRVGWKESKYRQSTSRDWVIFGTGYNKVDAFKKQIENFCAAIRGEDTLRVTAHDGLASVEVIEAAYRSLHSNNWVPVTANGHSPAPSGIAVAA